MKDKLLFFTGNIETLGFFSEQMIPTFQSLGYETFLFDFRSDKEGVADLMIFLQNGPVSMITFNFIGLVGEDADLFYIEEKSLWNIFEVTCYNIIVDHPFYYHEHLKYIPKHYIQLCIDRQHLSYMKRFFPEITLGGCLPLAGTALSSDPMPWNQRTTNVVFTGNYTPPQKLDSFITRNGDEYEEFYRSIIHDFISSPASSLEEIMEPHIRDEVEDFSESTLADSMATMIFIDLYIRFYFRGLAVATLADAGIPVSLYGAGWELLTCKHKENLLIHPFTTSQRCLEAISRAKISLNVMPWFKDGLHDRIMNSMLNGAVCVTDSSKMIDECFQNHIDLCKFSLEKMSMLPEEVSYLLEHPKEASEIAVHGFYNCKQNHTWANRAKQLHQVILHTKNQ